MTTVAVVGLGTMGARIARRLLDAGYELVVWNRSPEKLAPLTARGAIAAATPADAARRAEMLITMVTDPLALRAVTEAPGGIARSASGSLTVIEMSTVGPAAVADLEAALPRRAGLLDAPVLGSVTEAEAGSLTIFVGGPEALVELARPLLSHLGSVIHVGPLGAGAAAKLVANSALFGTLATLGEAIVLARGLGLSESIVFKLLAVTPLAGQAERRRRSIEAGDYPPRFPLVLARKDSELIRAAARTAGIELRVADAARAWLAVAETAGFGDRDYTSMLAAILGERRTQSRRPTMTRAVLEQGRPHDGLIIDLDGVIWLGGSPIEGAAAAVARMREHGQRVLFLTNDPQSSRSELAERLSAFGIPANAADVMTSAAATARFLASQRDLRGRAVFVVGAPALRQEVEDAGFEVVGPPDAHRAELVVVGGHDGFNFAELRAATRAIVKGAPLFAVGRDRVVPTKDGLEPATGAVLAAVETASGVTATVIGKPEPFIFEIAREMLSGCERIAVVGDSLASDIAGAKRAGIDAILVLSGVSRETEIKEAEFRPDAVLASLADL
ncbi:MAG TPA: HAD-IIA family hydrolase [Gaiellaceae bacterium]|nr:HAD-IIA family hydrolase [Gaiellaceae bacterium]